MVELGTAGGWTIVIKICFGSGLEILSGSTRYVRNKEGMLYSDS